jgi:ZIP family zinc transporter
VSEAVLVFLLALLTAVATGLGALPFLFARKPTRRWLGLSNAAAAGLMTAHSFTEGVGLGVSFGSGTDLGLFITLAIAVHNIPEGLAISLVLVPRGVGAGRAAFWSVFSSLPQPLMAVPAFAFVEAFGPLLPYGLGFAAGAMTWMVFAELLPDARREAPDRLVAVVVALSVFGMLAFQILVR